MKYGVILSPTVGVVLFQRVIVQSTERVDVVPLRMLAQ